MKLLAKTNLEPSLLKMVLLSPYWSKQVDRKHRLPTTKLLSSLLPNIHLNILPELERLKN